MAVSNTLKAVLDQLDEPRMIVRKDFTVAYANRAFRDCFGVVDFVGRRCHELLFHELRTCAECGEMCPLERAAMDGKSSSVVRSELMPGAQRLLTVTAAPLPGPDGEPVYFMETVSFRGGDVLRSLREGIVANSLSVRMLLGRMARVAPLDLPVLFEGESGVGKACFARTLHENSRRAAHAFIVVNCEGLTRSAFNDELLGPVGVDGCRDGGLAREPGGTLYFDEVLALSPEVQAKLLLLMEAGVVRAEGTAEVRAVDFRIFCATQYNLREAVQSGRLRKDLYYRLSVCALQVPPLRDRREDIKDLAELAIRRGVVADAELTDDALNYLGERDWPGNVRELGSLLERAALFAADATRITRADLTAADDGGERGMSVPATRVAVQNSLRRRLRPEDQERLRREALSWQGSRKAFATHAGISERTLYRLLSENKQ